ncbi:response regulator [Flaviaesturariibacter amylovorans]|uniref:Response regulatory domain-containing protein n=1 Tax=Flaviaesturariibacter amylovorans TaxID=1084520 RepID=A0ABP8GY78_9BACT
MNTHQVLWADDDPDDLMLFNETAHEVDREVCITTASNGLELIDQLNRAKTLHALPGMIITDMNMPVVTGREALVLIRRDEQLRRIPLVVFTTSSSSLDALFCLRHEVLMVTKPCVLRDLRLVIRNILRIRWP